MSQQPTLSVSLVGKSVKINCVLGKTLENRTKILSGDPVIIPPLMFLL